MVSRFLQTLAGYLDRGTEMARRLRAIVVYFRTGIRFAAVGRLAKVRGSAHMTVGTKVRIGDFCWIEAVASYGGKRYRPRLTIGDRVALSDLTHISCVDLIQIGDDCLLGSKIYIGDHNHGSISDIQEVMDVAPAQRPLADIAEIMIGEKTWIGDGAVILPGTRIGRCSIVGANSVVRLQEDRPALIAGVPARVIRYLDGEDGKGTR
jgi:acetyltransferase-like isoleucine patch superfamily enzyme